MIGSPSAGRGLDGSEALIGFFVNTLALRLTPGAAPDLETYLRDVARLVREGLEHEAAPFEQVVERVGVPRSLAHSPVFQVMFAWQNQEAGALRLGDLALADLPLGLGEAKFDLTLSLAPGAEGTLQGAFEYDADLFEPATVVRWRAALAHVLAQLAAQGDAATAPLPMASLRLTPPADLALLAGFNATARALPGRLLPDLLSDHTCAGTTRRSR